MACKIKRDEFNRVIEVVTENGKPSILFNKAAGLPFIENLEDALWVVTVAEIKGGNSDTHKASLTKYSSSEPKLYFQTTKGLTESYKEALTSSQGNPITLGVMDGRTLEFKEIREVPTTLDTSTLQGAVNNSIVQGLVKEDKVFDGLGFSLKGEGGSTFTSFTNANKFKEELPDVFKDTFTTDSEGYIYLNEAEPINLPETQEVTPLVGVIRGEVTTTSTTEELQSLDAVDPSDAQANFERWVGGNRLIEDAAEVQEVKTGEPVVIKAFHGTTHEFFEFNSTVKGTVEGHLGRMNYFTTSEEDALINYTENGPDFQIRIRREIDNIAMRLDEEYEFDSDDYESVFHQIVEDYNITEEELNERNVSPTNYSQEIIADIIVYKEFVGREERVLDVYVKLNNPVVLGHGYNVIDVNDRAQLINALQEAIENSSYDSYGTEGLAQEILQDYLQEEEINLKQLEKTIREGVRYQTNDDGEATSSHIFAEFFKNLGYDGIILNDVAERFDMGLRKDTSHVHVFDEFNNQIKLSDGSNVTFGETSDIRFSTQSETTQSTEIQRVLEPIIEVLKGNEFVNNITIGTSEDATSRFSVDGTTVKGAADSSGNVFINSDTVTLDTPIHEVGHLWSSYTKENNIELFNQGLKLIEEQGQEYIEFVQRTQPSLTGEALLEEALAQAIGDNGAKIVNAHKKSKLSEWLKSLFDWIAGQVGINEYFENGTYQDLTLDQFSTAVAIELLKGKPSGEIVHRNTYGNDKVSISVEFVEENKRGQLIREGRLKTVKNLGELQGYHIMTHGADNMFTGNLTIKDNKTGELLTQVEGNGGVYFVTKFKEVWASGSKMAQMGLINGLNAQLQANLDSGLEGRTYLALSSGAASKLKSNTAGVNSILVLAESLLQAELIAKSDFRTAVLEGLDKHQAKATEKDVLEIPKNISSSELVSRVTEFVQNPTNHTFNMRGNLVSSIVDEIRKSPSFKNNIGEIKKFLNTDSDTLITKKGDLLEVLANISSENMLQNMDPYNIYALIEITKPVVAKESSHGSYPFAIGYEDGTSPTLVIVENPDLIVNTIDAYSSTEGTYITPNESINPPQKYNNSNGLGGAIGMNKGRINVTRERPIPTGVEYDNVRFSVVTETGESTQEFFGNVVEGGDVRYSPSAPYQYEWEFNSKQEVFRNSYDSRKGNFDEHIATSIPTFRDLQVKTGAAIVSTYSRTPRVVNVELEGIKDRYKEEKGLTDSPEYTVINETLFQELSKYHEEVTDDRQNKEMKESYRAFLDETLEQYKMLKEAGYDLRPFLGEGEPYGVASDKVRQDLLENKRLYYLMSRTATGEGNETESAENYMPFEDTGITIDGQKVLFNDLFRVVHDVFGHGMVRNTFSAQGEFNAYQTHKTMYSEKAQKALFLETVVYNAYYSQNKRYAPRKIYNIPDSFILRANKPPLVVDLGGSEGSWIKAITDVSAGSIRTINVDPQPGMEQAFNKTPINGATMESKAFYKGWEGVETYLPKEKAEVVHESMLFQFIDNQGARKEYIKEVKDKYLEDGGIFLSEEKFKMDTEEMYKKNEELKEPHKNKYYTQEQQSLKADQVLVGMKENQANFNDYVTDLKEEFEFVTLYWIAGNFRGVIASNNKAKFDAFLENLGSTKNNYTYATEEEYTVEDIEEVNDIDRFFRGMTQAISLRREDGLQVEALTKDSLQQLIDEGGKLYMTKDNKSGAFVKSDGYMGGLFKSPIDSKKTAAKALQEKRLSEGGKFFDAFATPHLESLYIKNGFRPLIRMPFNEQYAPKGWEKTSLRIKPDVVFFVNDPSYEATMGEGQYTEDYDAAYTLSKDYNPQGQASIPKEMLEEVLRHLTQSGDINYFC